MPAKFRLWPTRRARAARWTTEAERQPVRFYLNGDVSHSVGFLATKTDIISNKSNMVEWCLVVVPSSFFVSHKSSLPLATSRPSVEGKSPNHWISSHQSWDRFEATGLLCLAARRMTTLKTNTLGYWSRTNTMWFWISQTGINKSKPSCPDPTAI